jgi:hypothetical protein
MQCNEFQQQVHAYLDETLEEPRREMWRQHLNSCADCREWALSKEPTLLFIPTRAGQPSPSDIEECVTAVTALIRQDRLNRRLHSRSRPWLAAAAAALISLGGGLLWLQSGNESGSVPTVELAKPEPALPELPPPEVEVDMDGEGIRVYHFATDGDENVAATFIVNPALEL